MTAQVTATPSAWHYLTPERAAELAHATQRREAIERKEAAERKLAQARRRKHEEKVSR